MSLRRQHKYIIQIVTLHACTIKTRHACSVKIKHTLYPFPTPFVIKNFVKNQVQKQAKPLRGVTIIFVATPSPSISQYPPKLYVLNRASHTPYVLIENWSQHCEDVNVHLAGGQLSVTSALGSIKSGVVGVVGIGTFWQLQDREMLPKPAS